MAYDIDAATIPERVFMDLDFNAAKPLFRQRIPDKRAVKT